MSKRNQLLDKTARILEKLAEKCGGQGGKPGPCPQGGAKPSGGKFDLAAIHAATKPMTTAAGENLASKMGMKVYHGRDGRRSRNVWIDEDSAEGLKKFEKAGFHQVSSKEILDPGTASRRVTGMSYHFKKADINAIVFRSMNDKDKLTSVEFRRSKRGEGSVHGTGIDRMYLD